MVYNNPMIDLNNNLARFNNNDEFNNDDDTTLRLECFGYSGSESSSREQSSKSLHNDGSRLVLGFGAMSSKYLNEADSILKLSLSHHSTTSKRVFNPLSNRQSVSIEVNNRFGFGVPVLDEGSTSGKKSGGSYMPSLLLAPRLNTTSKSFPQKRKLSEPESSVISSYSTRTTPDHQSSNKKCKFSGCYKGSRGSTGLCISHGGGQRCQKPGCNKGAESRSTYCKAHGGGKRCDHLGCMKSADANSEYCIAHGGGTRCSHPTGCNKAARGKTNLCIKHGGGKRCVVEGCIRSAEGQLSLCISHGGGRRCRFQGCNKGSQGSTMFCKAHGGGKRCVFTGCTKGAEGTTPLCKAHGGGKRCLYQGGAICPKSVHGGTNFCVAHGGGKRCAMPGCTKSARGRTSCCVKHGGGKRCKFDKCTKSAQGSTDFCKAHGGGRRCIWGGKGKCDKLARGKGGLCPTHSSMVQQPQDNNKNVPGIAPRLFHGLVIGSCSGSLDNHSLSCTSVVSNSTNPPTRIQRIPPQVLVPSSMKSSSFSSSSKQVSLGTNSLNSSKSMDLEVPEGRVHGGRLLSLLGGNLRDAFIDGI